MEPTLTSISVLTGSTPIYCQCLCLIYFVSVPRCVTVIFRRALFVCTTSGLWPDFPVIAMPTSFLPSSFSEAPDRGITPVHSPPRCERHSAYRTGGGRGENEGSSKWLGRRSCVSSSYPSFVSRCETCHSAGDGSFSVHASGINLYQKRVNIWATATATRVGNKGGFVLIPEWRSVRSGVQSHKCHKPTQTTQPI